MSMSKPECGLDVSLTVMGGKWKPLVLYHLRSGPKRFGDLKRLVAGISEKVLIQQLRELVTAEVLVRHDYQQVPPKVDYTLTPFGETLVVALLPLCDWGTQHRSRVEAMQASPMSLRSMQGNDTLSTLATAPTVREIPVPVSLHADQPIRARHAVDGQALSSQDAMSGHSAAGVNASLAASD